MTTVFYQVLSYHILSHPTLLYAILSCPISSNAIPPIISLSKLSFSNPFLFSLIQPNAIPSYPVLSHLILPCPGPGIIHELHFDAKFTQVERHSTKTFHHLINSPNFFWYKFFKEFFDSRLIKFGLKIFPRQNIFHFITLKSKQAEHYWIIHECYLSKMKPLSNLYL